MDDPFVCKQCEGRASYAGRMKARTIYRCDTCGHEDWVLSVRLAMRQQQQQQPGLNGMAPGHGA